MDDRDLASLYDMLTNARIVVMLARGVTRETLETDPKTRLSIERGVEIIGEAARRISKEYRSSHPEVPWKKIISTRHVLAHDYDDINYITLHRIMVLYIPELIELLTPLVPQVPSDPQPEP